jgi:di/tricarboxylate transporter
LEKFILFSTFIVLVVLLIIDKWKPSILFGSAAIFLMSVGIITPANFLAGFANESIVIVFLLVIITNVINVHFDYIKKFGSFLNGSKNTSSFLLKMGFGVSSLSSFINNTPLVAMMLPYVYNWGQKRNIEQSLLLIPLSYMVILGGMITVIGTSTNLVLNGFISSKGLEPLTTYDYCIPGILVTVFGVLYISIFGYKLLPKNKDVLSEIKLNLKEYLVETELNHDSTLIGKTIEEAKLRNLDGIFLVEIIRQSKVICPVEPNEIILKEDRLFFAGETTKVLNLINNEFGLRFPFSKQIGFDNAMEIIETVIPANSELIGKSLKEFQFREKYDAAVIAIHRNGERVRGKMGEITLDKGDLLMVIAGKNFGEKIKFDKNIYLVSLIDKLQKTSPKKNRFLSMIAFALLLFVFWGLIPFFVFLTLLLAALFFMGYTNLVQIKKQISLDLLIVLGSSISLSTALINSSLASDLSYFISNIIGKNNPALGIILIYGITVILTSFIIKIATVAIMFPIGMALIPILGIEPKAVFLAISFGASCCFLTPFGYQTNLMVQGPGNYKFIDYFKLGIPLTLIYSFIIIGWIMYNYL